MKKDLKDEKTNEVVDNKKTNNNRNGKGRNHNNGRHSRRNGNKNSGSKKQAYTDMKKSGANDISWYAQSPDLLRDVANFPWSTQNGLTYDLADSYVDINGNRIINYTDNTFTNPGIMCLRVATGIGNVEQAQDAVNIAANAIYTFVRHYNSGSANYNAPDLMMYLLQMDEIFCAINWVQRILGTVNMYNVFNRYTPQTLLTMQGVDYEDIKSNQVWLRAQLNTIITQAATLVVPNTLPLYERHRFMFSNYYIEGDDMKDQIYFMTPVCFRKLNIPAGGGPGSLNRVPIYAHGVLRTQSTIPTPSANPNNLMTANDIVAFMYDMVSTVYMSEDFGIMAGDILKAYGESNVTHLGLFNADYIAGFERNDEVLLQIKNATATLTSFVGYGSNYTNTSFGDIIQDPNTNRIYEVSDLPKTYWGTSLVGVDEYDSKLMMTLSGSSSDVMNMIMTRLQSYAKFIKIPSGVDVMRVFSGTEKVVNILVCEDIDPLHYSMYTTHNTLLDNDTVNSTYAKSFRNLTSKLQSFKYAPRFGLHILDNSTKEGIDHNLFWQVDNFTIYPREILDRMNAIAIMSEMNIPHIALIK